MKQNKMIAFLILLSVSMVFILAGCGSDGDSDKTPPTITIIGNNPETITYGSTYVDAGATVIDNKDDSVNVTSSGTVDVSTIGTYTITYTAVDNSGNKTEEIRTVNVIDVSGEDILNSPSAEKTLRYLEKISKWNDNGDEDGDGLTNSFEIQNLDMETMPDIFDTNGDGNSDASLDLDKDGLTNIEEQQYDTNPLQKDSDNDGIEDANEIISGTNPLDEDSDNDGLKDGDELIVGTQPLLEDTDGDGVLDGDEIFSTSKTGNAGVVVTVTGKGHAASQTSINEKIPDAAESNIPGLVSNIIDLGSEVDFDTAQLKIPITQELIDSAGGDINLLKIVLIDESSQEITFPEPQGISDDSKHLWATLKHFSSYGIVNQTIFNSSFDQDFYGSTRTGSGGLDLILAIDSSGSMIENDPDNLRISAGKNLISGLTDNLDRAAVIDFDDSTKVLQSLTMDLNAVENALNQIDSSGDTNIGVAVSTAINEISSSPSENSPLIILLTDGEGDYSDSLTQEAKEKGIRIYTVGLGASIDETLLRNIANGTDGVYYQVASADQLLLLFDDLRKETLDSDFDGLSDYAEINGMRTWYGFTITTDPNNPDTDGDGLKDGEEMGAVAQMLDGRLKYNMIADPTKIDTDGDSIDDLSELNGDPPTSALKKDTDGDKLNDNVDTYPIVKDWYGLELRPGDIILVGHNDDYEEAEAWDKGARIAMGTWSHAVMYMGEEKTIDAHPRHETGTDWDTIHEFLYPGCCPDYEIYCNPDLSPYFAKYDRIAFLKVKDKDDEAAARAAKKAEEFIGSNFEYPGWDTFSSSFKSDDNLYCAELIYRAWKSEGVDLGKGFRALFPFVRPKDIYNDNLTTIVKEIDPMPAHRPSK